MRKARRSLVILLAVVMVLCLVPAMAFGASDDDQGKVIAGQNRYDTAALIAKDAFSDDGADTVIIANGEEARGYADALAGSFLAGAAKAPILLTYAGTLPAETEDAIEKLNPTKAYVLGGELAISKGVYNTLKNDLGLEVERVAGGNRFETAKAVFEKGAAIQRRAVSSFEIALIANGYRPADALVAGAYAYANNIPVLLVDKDSIPAATTEALAGITKTYVIGGNLVVSDNVVSELNATRVAGQTQYATSVAVAEQLWKSPKDFALVKGVDGIVDALAGCVLGVPILYVDATTIPDVVDDYLDEVIAEDSEWYVLGGRVKEQVNNAVQGKIDALIEELKVVDVSAINGTQVEVKFSAKVDETTAETIANYIFNSLDSQPATTATTAELSKDGKTVTVTVSQPLAGRYQVIIDNILAEDGVTPIERFDEILKFDADTTAPKILGVERMSSTKVKIKFSEPVKSGTITAKYADGTTPAPTIVWSPAALNGDTELIADLSAAIDNKNIVVTFNGVVDMVGNLIDPQPSKVTIVKLPLDGIEPAIVSITQTGAKTFVIKFNKDLDGTLTAGNVTVDGIAATAIKKISASEYEFTMGANLDGLKTVTVAAGKAVDLDGQLNTSALTKVVLFKTDLEAPKATAKLVEVKGKECIQLTFDKDVVLKGDKNVTITGTKVVNYVTSSVGSVNVAVAYADASNKKVVLVPLTDPALAVEGAKYNVKINNKDASNGVFSDADVAMEEVSVVFTRGKDAPTPNTEVVTNVAVAQGSTLDEVVVIFTIPSGYELDGATATNLSNYSIAGAQIESIELEPVSVSGTTTTQVATLKLVKNSNTFTGVRNITIKNIKIAGSTKVMEPVIITNVSLNENVRPTIVKAELTSSTTIEVTFSEELDTSSTGGFEVYVGDTKLTQKDTATSHGKHTETIAGNKVTITLDASNAIDEVALAKGIKVKATSSTEFKDSVGNKLEPTTVSVQFLQ